MNEIPESLEWRSVVNAISVVDLRQSLPALGQSGIVAYTDGACIKNPGGPAGWCALIWSAEDFIDGIVVEGAQCIECYGHIPRSKETTNNRAEISAVLAVLSLAPPTRPLKIYSDSEYTIKVAQGTYQMKANPDLWAVYRKLVGYRSKPPVFEWVRGHAGHLHNERADELAGLGAWDGNKVAYDRWQASQVPEARQRKKPVKKALASNEYITVRTQVQKLNALFETIALDSSRVSSQERKFVQDMAGRLQKNTFALSDKQSAWIKGLVAKHKI
jgi:ribonuclease HI